MSLNTFFEINRLTKQVSNIFDDTDPSLVDHEFFTKEVELAYKNSNNAEKFLYELTHLIKQQQDPNLTNSRYMIEKVVKYMTTNRDSSTTVYETQAITIRLIISDQPWKFFTGQLVLLCSNTYLNSELYQHLLFDIAVNQKLCMLSFIEQSTHNYIFSSLIKDIEKADQKKALKFNANLIKLKNSRSYVEESTNYDAESFEKHLTYLRQKYKVEVVYISDISILSAVTSTGISKQEHLFQIGEYLMHLANKLNVCFIINYQHAYSDIAYLQKEISNVINYASQAIQFTKPRSHETLETSFFDVIDLKAYDPIGFDAYFNTTSRLICKTKMDNELH